MFADYERVIEYYNGSRDDIIFVRVNGVESPNLAMKYSVRYYPMVVYFPPNVDMFTAEFTSGVRTFDEIKKWVD